MSVHGRKIDAAGFSVTDRVRVCNCAIDIINVSGNKENALRQMEKQVLEEKEARARMASETKFMSQKYEEQIALLSENLIATQDEMKQLAGSAKRKDSGTGS